MIVTVTPNAVLDIVYDVDRLREGAVHEVRRMVAHAGGKGVNVTSVLMAMGHVSLATGFAGGPPGQTLLADLTDRGVPHLFTDVRESTRRIVTVRAADGTMTRFAEPGPTVTSSSWEQLRSSIEPLLEGPARALVVSGRMPRGSRPDASRAILLLARNRGVPTVVDARDEALLAAATARPDVVKPTVRELQEATGVDGPIAGARALQRAGARTVLVMLGAQGLLLVPEHGALLRACLPRGLAGDGLGAGDAAAAAIATGMARESWADLLRRGAAWAAASARQPTPGDIEPADVVRLEPLVRVEVVEDEELTLPGL